jgi:hypothetical protein
MMVCQINHYLETSEFMTEQQLGDTIDFEFRKAEVVEATAKDSEYVMDKNTELYYQPTWNPIQLQANVPLNIYDNRIKSYHKKVVDYIHRVQKGKHSKANVVNGDVLARSYDKPMSDFADKGNTYIGDIDNALSNKSYAINRIQNNALVNRKLQDVHVSRLVMLDTLKEAGLSADCFESVFGESLPDDSFLAENNYKKWW